MFCIHDPELHASTNPQHSRRILRSFRSHKNLKSATRTQDLVHQRRPSDASTLSVARSSAESSRSSSSRPARIVDLDPLRLHPPLAKSHLPFAPQSHSSARNNQHELRQARSLHNLNGAYASAHVGQPEPRAAHSRTVIYDGFDFGFDQTVSSRRREPMHDYYDDLYHQDRPPSSASSTSSGGSDFGPETPSDAQFHFQGLTPRPHVPGMDAADHFIKRGGWKRRGIVFETEVPMASEDECFDLELN
ncbi:hypothetical protein V8F20_000105 [Naviculisporaceae sp. PSN 640]